MESILTALTELNRDGSFCAKQIISDSSSLSISVKDFPTKTGNLKFPLSIRAAKSLIKLAKPAKYGWKDQTLLDPSVRDVWEIPKSRVKIDNRQWNKALRPALDEFKQQLGLPEESRLKAHLHNLLIYETGQFFRPHQDSEKLDGMLATLVVVLPSTFKGGTLIIDHQGEKKRFPASRSTIDKLALIAFYADCHHEVKPVTDGYRVTLTYNLVLENAPDQKTTCVSKSDRLQALSASLRDYFYPPQPLSPDNASENTFSKIPESVSPKKLVYLLDHQYTQKSLRWNRLKSDDQPRIDALRSVAKELQLESSLALADVHEIWDCEDSYDNWGYGRYRKRYWDDDECDRYNSGDGDYILHDLIDCDFSLQYWIDEKPQPVDYNGLNLSYDEFCWTKSSDDFTPFQSEYEGYMGNYGNTLDRWYHRAAIVLFRKQDRFSISCEIDPLGALKEILALTKKEKTLEQAQTMLTEALPILQRCLVTGEKSGSTPLVFKLAIQLGSAELAQSLLSKFGLPVLTPQTAKYLLKLEQVNSTDWCLSLLQNWSTKQGYPFNYYSSSNIEKIPQIISVLVGVSRKKNQLADWLIENQFNQIDKYNREQLEFSSNATIKENEGKRSSIMFELLLASHYANNQRFRSKLVVYIKINTALYSIYAVANIVELLFSKLSKSDSSNNEFEELLDFGLLSLKEKLKKGTRKKDNWSIEPSSQCGCDDCKKLNKFLQSANQTELRWPINQERRYHQHRKIEGLGIPVIHETERKGRPFTLVLTKNNKLFIQDKKQQDMAKKHLANLEKIKNRYK